MRFRNHLFTLLIAIAFSQCTERKYQIKNETIGFDDTYLKIYSGGYTIEVDGLGTTGDVELYVLADNGKAQWMYLVTAGRKEPEIMSRKYGSWTAQDSYIRISIDGNTGQLIEEYEMKDGVFYNKDTPNRYLKRTAK
jgi:hypothetical protein